MRDEADFREMAENGERMLELKLLGWSFRSVHQVTTPFPLEVAVDNVIKGLRFPPGHFETPKPQSTGTDKRGRDEYGPELIIAMRRLPYGPLRRHLRDRWDQYA